MLADLLEARLRVVFVGTSVGDESARRGHYYASANNKFWDLLEATGLTGGAGLAPESDREITRYGVGLSDLVKTRAASSDRRLLDTDYDVPGLLRRIARYRPCVVGFNGKEATQRVAHHLGHPVPGEGALDWKIEGSAAYRLPSSSGANARGGYERKVEAWQTFGDWVRERC